MVVMFHGGGWCTGFPVMEEATCRNMVQAFGAVCVSCSYRLAPEFKFPTGVLDAYDALKWAAAQAKSFGADPKQGFVLGGTSAGANFTAVLAHRARDEGLQPPLTGVSYAFPFVLGEPNLPHVPEKYRDRAISYRQNESAPGIAKAAGEMLMRGYEPDIQDHDQCECEAARSRRLCPLGIVTYALQLLQSCTPVVTQNFLPASSSSLEWT